MALSSIILAAQLSEPNESGIAMGHVHFTVEDVAQERAFWIALGGEPIAYGDTEAVRFPDVLVFLEPGRPSGGSEGAVVDHLAFRVEALEKFEAAGMAVERLEAYPGVAGVRTPSGERIELFDETATNLTFTPDPGYDDPTAERHNRPITHPVIAHHIHLYVPEGEETDAQAWYAGTFGGTPGMRWRYAAVDLPGINLNFSASAEPTAPTAGRRLDHIGFEVKDLEAFSQTLVGRGIDLDIPYTRDESGLGRVTLTDPWGTRIVLTEGLDGL